MELSSPAFKDGEMIPRKFTCDGENISPALAWSGVPEDAASVALLVEDPDAPRGTFTHWIYHEIPATQNELPEGGLPGARQGQNDFRRPGYGGPCPPPGAAHRYVFRLYALDVHPALDPGAGRQDFLNAIQGHILAQAELTGRYARS